MEPVQPSIQDLHPIHKEEAAEEMEAVSGVAQMAVATGVDQAVAAVLAAALVAALVAHPEEALEAPQEAVTWNSPRRKSIKLNIIMQQVEHHT